MPTEEEMNSMLHYHLELVHEAAGTSVVEHVNVDRHRACMEITRAELVSAFTLLGYRFNAELLTDGRSELLLDFHRESGITASFSIHDCACPWGELTLIARVANLN